MSARLLLLSEKLNWPLSACSLLINLAFLSGLRNPRFGDFKSLNLLDTSLLEKTAEDSKELTCVVKSKWSAAGKLRLAFLELEEAKENFKGFEKCLPSVVELMFEVLLPELGSIGKLDVPASELTS